ncbi:MAG: ComF family protein [Candidatus Azobacteroides sp.]|nr:ComF family protein [Candidatus Azobacteroides sp.]
MDFGRLFKNFWSLFYPKLCVGCAEALMEHENFFCPQCLLDLPKTNYHRIKNNPAYDRFAGKISLQRASSYLYYNKGGLGQRLVAEFKYRGNIHLGEWIAAMLAAEMLPSGFFEGIDWIVPTPLHPQKQKLRGFNQAEILGKGISKITHIPMETGNLYRIKANVSQTRKGVYDRWKNTQGIFDVKNIEAFNHKHLLLIDDVLTTGATLEACAQAFSRGEKIKISILTLTIA